MEEKIEFRNQSYTEKTLLDYIRQRREAGDFQSAESACYCLFGQNPKNAEALHLSALNLYHFGAVASAVYWIKRAIVLDEKNPAFHYNLGIILSELGKKEAAQASFEKAIGLDSGYKIRIDKFKRLSEKFLS